MKNLFLWFVIWLLLAGWAWLWYFYAQPLDVWSDVDNWPRQNNSNMVPALWYVLARWTEPFWTLELTGWNLVWQAPWLSGTDIATYTGITQFSSGSTYILTDGINSVMLTITPGICNDGMSETAYSWTAYVNFATWPNLPLYNWCAIW